MIKILVKFLIIFINVQLATSVNYCDLCSNHIACKNLGNWSSYCPQDAQLVTLTSGNMEVLLNTHNYVRNLLAGGKVSRFKSASKMMTLKWDPELAFLASLNVKQCQMKHDECRKTENYPLAGQNLYYLATTGQLIDINSYLEEAVNAWFDEYQFASQSNIDKCCGENNLSKIGHFLQVVQDKAVAIGCAVARYSEDKWKTTLIACNYSYGNIVDTSVYKVGSPASACPQGKNSDYTNLCE